MDPARTIFLVLGIFLLAAGALLLYVEAGLDRWISMTVLGAGLLILIGLAVMGFASGARSDRPVTTEREIHHEREPPRRY